jgi:pimeloyl-ACP methyl ester carboxylesterase
MPSTTLLKRWISRAFLRPSHHYIPCQKEEILLGTRWGKVQLWREYSERDQRRPAQVCFLRFLGSRGRAEMATLDPADRLDGRAAEVWTLNPPAFGASSGPAELERYADCALAALDYLCARIGVPVWVCGKSLGTAAALLAAAHGGPVGAVLRNVMPLRELLTQHYSWRTAGFTATVLAPAVPARLDCVANAAQARVPALFVVSRNDRVSPPSYQRKVIEAYRGPTSVLEVAGGHDERRLGAQDEAAYGKALRNLIGAQRLS